jgi:hypothetical protein
VENAILIVNLTATISIIFLADDMSQATSSSQEVIVNRENVELALKRFAKMETDSLDTIELARGCFIDITVKYFSTTEGVRDILLTSISFFQIK